jgi:hypothetical protein
MSYLRRHTEHRYVFDAAEKPRCHNSALQRLAHVSPCLVDSLLKLVRDAINVPLAHGQVSDLGSGVDFALQVATQLWQKVAISVAESDDPVDRDGVCRHGEQLLKIVQPDPVGLVVPP